MGAPSSTPSFADLMLMRQPPSSFAWVEGVTPLADKRVVGMTVVVYVGGVLFLKRAMGDSKLKSLGPLPSLHNLILCLWSLAMFVGTALAALEETASKTPSGGAAGDASWMLCFPPNGATVARGKLFYWSYVYYVSKFYELLDTVLLVLKGRPLTFLHVFHHAFVLVMCYLWLEHTQSLQHIALLTNAGIHVVMYFYYFLTTLGVRPAWKVIVTNGQIVQFVFSFACSVPFVWTHVSSVYMEGRGGKDGGGGGGSGGGGCAGGCAGFGAWCFNAVFNGALLLLFANFHVSTYGGDKKRKARSGGGGGGGTGGKGAAATTTTTTTGAGKKGRTKRA